MAQQGRLIFAGDYVWSYDTENDKKVLARVTDLSVTKTSNLVKGQELYTKDGNIDKVMSLLDIKIDEDVHSSPHCYEII